MNIILVVFDTLRKDCVGVYGSPPWGKVHTPHLDAFARESLVMTQTFPESLPTLPARRALYTGQRVYPFHNANYRLKGDFFGAAGWGPIPEEQATLAEILHDAGYRTALVSDLYHMFKPSKNYWRGFDEWLFLRGKETDRYRSGPRPIQAEIDYWLPKAWQSKNEVDYIEKSLMNVRERTKEEEYFAARVFREAALWLEQNQDAEKFFLTIESFDPHEPWFVPSHYRKMYSGEEVEQEVVTSRYNYLTDADAAYVRRAQVNYSAAVTFCDRWLGHFMESLRVLGLLDNTMVVFTSDHGHCLGEGNYMGKWGYHGVPAVMDLPLFIRFPGAQHAGITCDIFVQFHDITAAILDAVGVQPAAPIDGISFLPAALAGQPWPRKHVTVGWGTTPTVITDRWWLNCKMDGTGALLYDLRDTYPFARSVARKYPEMVKSLFALAQEDARGGFPDWLLDLAKRQADAPGCSDLAARK